MKCNAQKIMRQKWQQDAIEVARQAGIEEAKAICDRESEDVMRRCFNLYTIAAKQAGLSARKCKEIQNNLERYVVPEWERMVNSDDQIGNGVGDFWAKDQLQAGGYPYYKPLQGEM